MVCSRRFESDIVIEAPPATVWATLTDFDAYSEWNSVIPKFKVDELKAGAKAKTTLHSRRGTLSFSASITKVDPEAKELRWMGRFPIPGMFKGEHFLRVQSERDGQATRFIHGEDFTGVLVPIFSRLVKAGEEGIEEMNKSLKLRAESIAVAIAAANANAAAAGTAAGTAATGEGPAN